MTKERNRAFQPVASFSWETNRSERTHQVRWLVPLLQHPEGRAWFLENIKCPSPPEHARLADVFHLCFPLRDIFSYDYDTCRGIPPLEDQFMAYYNHLFGLPEDFGIEGVWRTAPGRHIRHPAAGGRAGWYEEFLKERIADKDEYRRARDMRRMLGTEADALLLTARHVILVECKYRSEFSLEQYRRQKMMGDTLGRRLSKAFHFGMVAEDDRDPRFTRIQEPYVTWDEVQTRLEVIRAADPPAAF